MTNLLITLWAGQSLLQEQEELSALVHDVFNEWLYVNPLFNHRILWSKKELAALVAMDDAIATDFFERHNKYAQSNIDRLGDKSSNYTTSALSLFETTDKEINQLTNNKLKQLLQERQANAKAKLEAREMDKQNQLGDYNLTIFKTISDWRLATQVQLEKEIEKHQKEYEIANAHASRLNSLILDIINQAPNGLAIRGKNMPFALTRGNTQDLLIQQLSSTDSWKKLNEKSWRINRDKKTRRVRTSH